MSQYSSNISVLHGNTVAIFRQYYNAMWEKTVLQKFLNKITVDLCQKNGKHLLWLDFVKRICAHFVIVYVT